MKAKKLEGLKASQDNTGRKLRQAADFILFCRHSSAPALRAEEFSGELKRVSR
jgi:hypothetical protein